MPFEIDPITPADRSWIKRLVQERWGAPIVVSRGQVHRPETLPGFVARQQGQVVGLITYRRQADQVEIVTIDSLVEKQGIGTALIEAVRQVAQAAGCARLWLITTNDNLTALSFYQKRGFVLVQIHRQAVDTLSRPLKPAIPELGQHGIPIRDEIELEMRL
jgi:N-acetylglutamate synthase-like GNAT family acetyltransferase